MDKRLRLVGVRCGIFHNNRDYRDYCYRNDNRNDRNYCCGNHYNICNRNHYDICNRNYYSSRNRNCYNTCNRNCCNTNNRSYGRCCDNRSVCLHCRHVVYGRRSRYGFSGHGR